MWVGGCGNLVMSFILVIDITHILIFSSELFTHEVVSLFAECVILDSDDSIELDFFAGIFLWLEIMLLNLLIDHLSTFERIKRE